LSEVKKQNAADANSDINTQY